MELTVNELAKRLKADIHGDGSCVIRSVGPVASADRNTLTFVTDDRHLAELKTSHAGAVIVGKAVEQLSIPHLVVKNVNASLIEALKIFAPEITPAAPGVHKTAMLAANVKLGKNVSIGPCVVIEEATEIGDNTVIAAGCKIGQQVKIGQSCRLDPNVVVYHRSRLGNSVIIQANSTIGSTGFGYYFIDGAHRLIPHNGIVVIEDFVEIGANSCVDRAKFGETRIGAGTKIDNLVQIAHNVTIGKCCLIVAQVGIAGSAKIGDGVVLAGQAGVGDNIEIGNGAVVGAQAGVIGNVEPGKQVLLMPAVDRMEALRATACMYRLPKFFEQVKQLASRVEKLESQRHEEKNKNT